ncbi:hypothetical protein MRX96_015502 [Rhipicephalus microplus]
MLYVVGLEEAFVESGVGLAYRLMIDGVMARIAGFTIISTILLTAMVDSVLGIDNQSEKEQEGESDNQKMEDKQDVDIAKFYSKREVIWIISVSNTQFPCKVDFVSDANGTHTLFTRHHREGVRFPKRDLIGEFRTEAREAQNGLNAMQVSPQRENARRDNNVGSWRSLESRGPEREQHLGGQTLNMIFE